MPSLDELYPSRWLKAADIKGRQVTVTIEKIVIEDLGDESKPVAYFVGRDKGVVLNVTNARTIADIVGSNNTDDWVGKKITLFTQKVNFQNRLTDAIRVLPPAEPQQVRGPARPAAAPATATPLPSNPEEADNQAADDNIPW